MTDNQDYQEFVAKIDYIDRKSEELMLRAKRAKQMHAEGTIDAFRLHLEIFASDASWLETLARQVITDVDRHYPDVRERMSEDG